MTDNYAGYGERVGHPLRRSSDGKLGFWCPGCGDPHYVSVASQTRPNWTFDGNFEAPTFSPSILVTWGWPDEPRNVCHSFVNDGQIQFLDDCTHALAGQTVPLPAFEP